MTNLRFISTSELERQLDGSDERFAAYFFAIYNCSPDDPGGINKIREWLKQEYPTKAIPVGRYFVLLDEAAAGALNFYFQTLIDSGLFQDDYVAYANRRLKEIEEARNISQSLLIPGTLTEGQLANDFHLAFVAGVAISKNQIIES
ncbi:hypothetical protein [Methylovulum psychrotolerans]|uniref:Uncharacterized protein n=1 Tax=Methylovulum psychrotolerans TaxID=1704499 RepID=A0A2S5CNB3_9GAMM|nr:hypothetical protein [Methylovulum psychrotolerans]POZ52232.1 hypothetical protein AADEFJLK_01707 [Methylovulum psychrotolerans]